ncbi:MAG: carbohydrate ABC transporter permease [Oscillospiraceae bacterium]|jgi:putative aldouronate transport system permease protein|nr:carbohydrate ABC transporter permease [Oscillospiraceae bacterium]
MSIIKNQTVGSRIFDVFNYTIMGLIAVVMVFPLFFVVIGSFSISGMIGGFNAFSLDAYKYIFTTNSLARSTINSVFITVVGTFINIVMTSITAYALSKKYLAGRNVMMTIIVIFMLFNPGMIPNYLVVSKLHMTNSFLSLWLPGAISAYNMIIMKNFFQGLPDSIEESAKIDGCHDLQVFLKIVLPISKASLATITLFYAVGHWNSYFNAMMYINDIDKWPIQVWLRQIIVLSVGGFAGNESLAEFAKVPSDAVKYAVICVSTLPIIVVYPFLQKYFAKGVLLGSVKG